MWVAAFPRGHSICSALPDRGAKKGKIYQDYLARMRDAYGIARAEELLATDWHNTLYYPNMSIQLLAQHIRVIKPVGVDRTEVWVYPVFLKGVPDEMNHDVIRYLNITHSSASLIQTDDLEQFARIQKGLLSDGTDWVSFERGIGGDRPTERGGFRADGSSELAMRMQYRAWKSYMFGEQ
jgi:benzoate/toluate 1,2-dioxygenase subunit alpha